MIQKFETLCILEIQHEYFSNDVFTGISIVPVADTGMLLKRYGIICKSRAGQCILLYETPVAGQERTREELLQSGITLRFRLELQDNSFYNYTGDMPPELGKKIFWLGDMDAAAVETNRNGLLHKNEFAGIADMIELEDLKKSSEAAQTESLQINNSGGRLTLWPDGPAFEEIYFKRPFGFAGIKLQPRLADKLYIRFPALATYWRYLLKSPHLQKIASPAIIDKATGESLDGPALLLLPDGTTVKSFITKNKIKLTRQPNLSFLLGSDYDTDNKIFQSQDQYVLPNPDIHIISKIDDGGNIVIKKNVSNIIL